MSSSSSSSFSLLEVGPTQSISFSSIPKATLETQISTLYQRLLNSLPWLFHFGGGSELINGFNAAVLLYRVGKDQVWQSLQSNSTFGDCVEKFL